MYSYNTLYRIALPRICRMSHTWNSGTDMYKLELRHAKTRKPRLYCELPGNSSEICTKPCMFADCPDNICCVGLVNS